VSINVGDAVVKLGLDKAQFSEGMKKVGEDTKSSMEKVQTGMRIAGAAMTAVGIAGLKLTADARKMNAQLTQTGLVVGSTTKEMRDLVLSISDVTFSLNSAIATLDLLARAGVRDMKLLKQNALAFDTLADAIGLSAEQVADILIPAYKMFGETLPRTANEMDKWTWLVRESQIELTELGGVMGYVAAYGRDLNLTSEQLIVMMRAMSEQGMGAAEVTRLLRTGITQAEGSVEKLYEILGLTTEELEKYTEELSLATGITQANKDVTDEQYSILDDLKHKLSEVALEWGSFLRPLEPILVAMSALGPMLIGLTLIMPKVIAAFTALRIKMHTVGIAATAMWAKVTLGISLVIVGLIALLSNWDKVVRFFKGPAARAAYELDKSIQSLADTMRTDVEVAINKMISDTQRLASTERRILEDRQRFWKEGHYERMRLLDEEFLAELMAIDPILGLKVKAIDDELRAMDEATEARREAQDKARIEEIKTELLRRGLTKAEETRLGDELLDLESYWRERDILEQRNLLISEANLDEHYGEEIRLLDIHYADIIQGYQNDLASFMEHGELKLDYLRNEYIPEYNRIMAEAGMEAMEIPDLEEREKAIQAAAAKPAWWEFLHPLLMLPRTIEDIKRLLGGEITSLQHGGIVPGPVGQPRLVKAHGGEQYAGVGQTFGTGDIHLHIGNYMGDETSMRHLGQRLKQILQENERRNAFPQVNKGYYYGKHGL